MIKTRVWEQPKRPPAREWPMTMWGTCTVLFLTQAWLSHHRCCSVLLVTQVCLFTEGNPALTTRRQRSCRLGATSSPRGWELVADSPQQGPAYSTPCVSDGSHYCHGHRFCRTESELQEDSEQPPLTQSPATAGPFVERQALSS